MAKGNSSATALKRLSHELSQFVLSWSDGNQKVNKYAGNGEWPAPYRLAALKGEAVLRQQFFSHFIPSLPHQPDSSEQWQLWQSLVEQSGKLTDFINRIGIKAALRREAPLPEHSHGESRMLYTILCQALAETNPALLVLAVDQFMLHQWRQQFPQSDDAQASATGQHKPDKQQHPQHPSKTTPARQREQLLSQLRKAHKRPIELRESFSQTAEQVHFKLLTRSSPSEPWASLIETERPRLSQARQAAYQSAIQGIKKAPV